MGFRHDCPQARYRLASAPDTDTPAETRIEIGAGEALGPVLGRVISMLATRADFSHQLTDAEAAEYTVERVMKGWEPQTF